MVKKITFALFLLMTALVSIEASDRYPSSQKGNQFMALALVADAPYSNDISVGLMSGMFHQSYGGYVKFRHSPKFVNTPYTVSINYEMNPWVEDAVFNTRSSITCGAMYQIKNFLIPFAGIGYGCKNVYTNLLENKDYQHNKPWYETGVQGYALLSDYVVKGPTFELGLMLNIHPFVLSFGVNCTAVKYTDLELGIGLCF